MLLEYTLNVSLLNIFLLLGMLYVFLFLYTPLTFSSNTYLKTEVLEQPPPSVMHLSSLPNGTLLITYRSPYQKVMSRCHSQKACGVSLLTLCPGGESFPSSGLGYVTQAL